MKSTALLLIGSLIVAHPATAQQPPPPSGGTIVGQPPPFAPPYGVPLGQPPQPVTPLPKFNLDFAGGSPQDLIVAIQKATGKPLNAIIPEDIANVRIPSLRMKSVSIPQLFEALEEASKRFVEFPGRGSTQRTAFGFRSREPLKEDAVWYFFQEGPPKAIGQTPAEGPVKLCRFWQLSPYLETYDVADITTAIDTGWHLSDDTGRVALKYHKETTLLIAVGEAKHLHIIDAVLESLRTPQKDANTFRPAPPRNLPPQPAKQ